MSDLTPRFRPVLDTVAAYRPGKEPVAPAGLEAHKLSSNESPHGPLPSVLKVLAEAAGEANRYPDHRSAALTAVIAERFGVPAEHVAVGNGSVGLLQQLLLTVSDPGNEVIFPWRSFEAYPILTAVSGATGVPVPLRADEHHDLEAMAQAITPRTRMIMICSPNNPTGTAVRERELTEFLGHVPGDCLVVLDEAYHEYIRDPQIPDGLQYYADRPNVAVLRTFSKAYGLAGLRVGFLVGHPQVAGMVRATQLPFAVNALAQAAAIASLDAQQELLERVETVVGERDRVVAELREDGWTVPDTQANFVWLRTGEQTGEFADACNQAGVAVRPYAPDGTRISIGTRAANDTFLAAAHAFPHRS